MTDTNISAKEIEINAPIFEDYLTNIFSDIISIETNENDDCNIDDFLIVTFTNAAAKELSDRIRKKLSERDIVIPILHCYNVFIKRRHFNEYRMQENENEIEYRREYKKIT